MHLTFFFRSFRTKVGQAAGRACVCHWGQGRKLRAALPGDRSRGRRLHRRGERGAGQSETRSRGTRSGEAQRHHGPAGRAAVRQRVRGLDGAAIILLRRVRRCWVGSGFARSYLYIFCGAPQYRGGPITSIQIPDTHIGLYKESTVLHIIGIARATKRRPNTTPKQNKQGEGR
jgi:hypothetical protein